MRSSTGSAQFVTPYGSPVTVERPIQESERGARSVGLVASSRYRLEVDLSSASGRVVTKAEVEFRAPGGLRNAEADLDVVAVRRMVLNGPALPADCHVNGRVRLSDLGAVNVLSVEADVAVDPGGDGLVEHVDDEGDRYVHTNLHPRRDADGRLIAAAACLLPCFDDVQRTPFEITIVAPAGWVCVANGELVDRPAAGAAGPWRFMPSTSSRGVAFVAGPWASVTAAGVHDDATEMYARRALASELSRSPVAGLAMRCAAEHEAALGVINPFPHQPIVFVPEYAQLGGGGEVLMLHESLLHASLDPGEQRYVLWAIAHEAAHSWFGFMTASAPEEAWLMEGPATFMGHRAMAALAPELHPWPAFHIIEEAAAHQADTAPDATPVVRAGHPSLVYSKPAAIVRHLAHVVGERRVLDGLGRWLERHPFAQSRSDEFVRDLSDAIGVDLGHWADDWLHTPGVNILELTVGTAAEGLVTSARVLQHSSPPGGLLRTHHTSVEIYDASPAGLRRRDRHDIVVTETGADVPVLVGRPAPALAVLNAPATTYARVRLDHRSRQALAAHLGELAAETRATCWVAALGMVQDGVMAADELADLIARYGREEPDAVVSDILTATAPRIGLAPAWETWTGALGDDAPGAPSDGTP